MRFSPSFSISAEQPEARSNTQKEAKMSKKGMKFSAFMMGALFGGLVGATVALLYAPRSGEETRTLIRDKSEDLKNQARERGTELRHQAEETADKARHRFEETANQTRQRAAEFQKRSQSFIDEQRNRVMQAIESGKATAKEKTPAVVTNGVEEA
jgi:gas vesicle protein